MERLTERPRHGHAPHGRGSPTHISWRSMIARCTYPAVRGYANYGGRGIVVCERWRLFVNFLADMGERPEGTTLDRIDVNGNYEPANCRWATLKDQRHNTSRSKLSVADLEDIFMLVSDGAGMRDLMSRYGISDSYASRLVTRYRRAKLLASGGGK